MGVAVRKIVRAVLGGLATAIVLVGAAAPPALADGEEAIRSYTVDLKVDDRGVLHVTETIDYDFGTENRHGIYRTIPVSQHYDDTRDRLYPVRKVEVTGSPGTPVNTSKKTESGRTTIRIGDKDRTITGAHTYVISYEVPGAISRFGDHDELYWNAIGTEWSTSIANPSVRLTAPVDVVSVSCTTGQFGSVLPCDQVSAQAAEATFGQDSLDPFSGLTIVAVMPPGSVTEPGVTVTESNGETVSDGPMLKERWNFKKALGLKPAPLGASGLLLVGGLFGVGALAWRTGRDRRFVGQVPGLEPVAGGPSSTEARPLFASAAGAVEFAPPKDMRPAEAGVLIDERADPLDVTATIVDLAVRKYLHIEELERKHRFAKRDWKLTRLQAPSGETLLPYETRLLDALFRSGNEVQLSALKMHFASDLAAVQGGLYGRVVELGWFRRRPDKTRSRWSFVGLVVVVAGVAATFWLLGHTHFGVLGFPIIASGLALMAVSSRMPARTASGSAVLARVLGFRTYLHTAEAEQLRFEEREKIFARYLPYAIIFGEADRWAKVFADLAAMEGTTTDSVYWYSGPQGWNPSHLGDSMASFTTTTSGTLTATASSSSGSSGGFSGGGGGGGGSW
jgi:hypothetical protein